MSGEQSERAERIRGEVRAGYARVAASAGSGEAGCGCGPACCAPGATGVSERMGYEAAELAGLPEGAEMGLGCGNPTALASLREGEVVLDLGAGGGVDVFLAGKKVGARGRAIGVDMTAEMVGKARAGIGAYRERTGLENVEFRLGEIERLPVADASVDVVISNCVINLSPDKASVWREIGRVLRPGGRVAVSDIVLMRPLPEAVAEMLSSWVGCVAGACGAGEVRELAGEAGLVEVEVAGKPEYVAALEEVQDPLYRRMVEHLPEGMALGDFIVSANITARKPGGGR